MKKSLLEKMEDLLNALQQRGGNEEAIKILTEEAHEYTHTQIAVKNDSWGEKGSERERVIRLLLEIAKVLFNAYLQLLKKAEETSEIIKKNQEEIPESKCLLELLERLLRVAEDLKNEGLIFLKNKNNYRASDVNWKLLDLVKLLSYCFCVGSGGWIIIYGDYIGKLEEAIVEQEERGLNAS